MSEKSTNNENDTLNKKEDKGRRVEKPHYVPGKKVDTQQGNSSLYFYNRLYYILSH